MVATSSLEAWLDAARFAHKVDFFKMARGGRWHLCMGSEAGGGGAMILPAREVADFRVIVRDVQSMTAGSMSAAAARALTCVT